MKALIFSLLLGCSSWSASAQNLKEPVFDQAHTLDYMVVYDNSKQKVMEEAGGEQAYARQIVESINLVLKNSNINYRFRLAGVHHMDATAPSIEEGLNMLEWDEGVAQARKKMKADIVVLLTEPVGDSNSGLAIHQAKHPDAFSCVMSSMAASAYTAAHEAGHVLGAYHSRSEYDHSPSTHPWAAAYISPKGYRTVMNTIAPGTTVPIYSGPESIWGDEVMGDATHDNVRMLRMNFPKMVHYGDYLDANKYYVTENDLIFDKNAHEYEVTFFGNSFFQITASADWIKLKQPNKNWSNVELNVPFSVELNYTGKDRVGYLEFTTCDHPNQAVKVKITQTASDVVFDFANGSYNRQQADYVEQVSFIRDFKNTGWQTLYVPFSWRNNDWKELFDIAKLKKIQKDDKGQVVVEIERLTTGDTEPNTPYLIRAKKPGKKNIQLKYINLYPAPEKPMTWTLDGNQYAFTGTYSGIDGQDMYNQQRYRLDHGALKVSEDVNEKMTAFQWYLSITNADGKPMSDLSSLQIVDPSEKPTGIGTLLQKDAPMDVYDVEGRLILKNASSTEGLPSGIYVINGKKVVL